jgi:hypothetical protein
VDIQLCHLMVAPIYPVNCTEVRHAMTIANQAIHKLTDPAMLEELRRAHEEFPLISIKETRKNIRCRSALFADGKPREKCLSE